MKAQPLRMKQLAGAEEYAAGRELEESGRVKLAEQNAELVRYTIAGAPPVTVTMSRDMDFRCDCGMFRKGRCCRHVVAAWVEAERTKVPEHMLRITAPEHGGEMLDVILDSMPAEANVRLEVTLAAPVREEDPLRMGFRIGDEKMYVVRDIGELLRAMETGEPVVFGNRFTYEPSWMRLDEGDRQLLGLAGKILLGEDSFQRMIRIPEPFIPDLMNLLEKRSFRLMTAEGEITRSNGIQEVWLPLRFDLSSGPRGITVQGNIPTDFWPLGRETAWGILGKEIIRISRSQRKLARLLWEKQYDGRMIMEYSPKDTGRVIGEVLPWLKLRAAVNVSNELRVRLVQKPLRTEVYLDRDGKSVVAAVRFRYGDVELNPFSPVTEKITLDKGDRLLLRDAEAEHQVLEILANAGFRVGREALRLSGSDAVFDFVSEGVKKLQECGEVYLSRDFKRLIPRRPALRGGMRMNGEQLELMLEADGEPTDEVMELMEALSRRRRYFRLKNGEFLDLSDLAAWQETAEAVYEAAVRDGSDLNRNVITLRAYRAGYLSSMLESSGIPVEQDESIRAVSQALSGEVEAGTPALAPGMSLRDYQRRGYQWMIALDRMHMGGILADSMGLGKTAQVIAVLSMARKPGQVSLVVAPTSLTYNWLSEIHRFAPDLTAAVLGGASAKRTQLIRHALEHGDVDILITSYPLIRRDIEQLAEYHFRFVILDEAQNIKNAGSIAATAVKRLQADTRFALTGTPMENGVGELWSLFDFVLPGYLPGYNTFLRRYQDGENAEDLLRRIRPFLIRRLKQDVLKELPDKIECVMKARMTQEQERVYHASLERLRPRVNQIMEQQGMNRGRMEILSAITELRQICCHPSLVIGDYRGSSGKEDLLMDILPDLIGEGRRILLFSQFTGMLKMLRGRLEEAGRTTLYLDGDTPAGERLSLTERFNAGEGEIFLISLRAGGFGLNLTGADTVIHYDPWWNPATEDQATDRAHRIGQTKKVQVIRLVTGESIEEQVVELGARKKALFDRLITPGESVLSALSEQDIRGLFI